MIALQQAGSKERGFARAGLVWLAVLLVAGALLSSWVAFVLAVALSKALVVLGVILLMRAGLVSFGQGLYFAAGAYTAAFAMRLWGISDAVVLLLLAAVVSVLVAMLLGPLMSRYREIFFAMLSLAFSMILYGLLLKAYWLTGGTDGIGIREPSILGLHLTGGSARLAYYYLAVVVSALCLYLVHRYDNSPLGYVVRGIRDNDIRLEYMGVSVRRAILATYAVAGALAGLGGALNAFAVGHVTPDFSYWTTSGEVVFIALLSGAGSVLAPVAGSIVFQFLQTYAAKYAAYTWQMIMGVTMLLIILFLPGGLWSLYENMVRRRARSRGEAEGEPDSGDPKSQSVLRRGPGL